MSWLSEGCFVSRIDRPVLRVAATVALMLALAAGLSACGRKGPLDPPPGASANSPAQDLEYDSQGRPLAPKGEKKRLPIDWLLD
jgi:predicted small lipoprotein YifL